MTEARTSQTYTEAVVAETDPRLKGARTTQLYVEVLVGAVDVRVAQEAVEVVVAPQVPARVAQEAVEVVVAPQAPIRVAQEAVEVVVYVPPPGWSATASSGLTLTEGVITLPPATVTFASTATFVAHSLAEHFPKWTSTVVLTAGLSGVVINYASWAVTGGVISTESSESMLAEDGSLMVTEQEASRAGFVANPSRVYNARWEVAL